MDELVKFLKGEEGVTAIEYALIAFLIAIFIIGALTATGTALSNVFQTIVAAL